VPLNTPQQLFLDQARFDYEIYAHLKRQNICHRLHYLQMCTEKLAKTHFWRHGNPPKKEHFVFVQFLRDLDSDADFHKMFGYVDRSRFDLQKASIVGLAQRLQDLAPAKNNGPNPEYPWPPNMPTSSPLRYSFPEWQDWNETTSGRRLKMFVENLLQNYTSYFP
jgi:hypothetical protein